MASSEDDLCRAFASSIKDSREFMAWVLAQMKFAKYRTQARLLWEEQRRRRPEVHPENWWRHWWCRIPELGEERETDIFLVFETEDTGTRFALHVENKPASGFSSGQAEAYRPRARFMMNKERYLSYSDFETVLIAPRSVESTYPKECKEFDRFLPYEDIAGFARDFMVSETATSGRAATSQADRAGSSSLPGRDPIRTRDGEIDWTASVRKVHSYFRDKPI